MGNRGTCWQAPAPCRRFLASAGGTPEAHGSGPPTGPTPGPTIARDVPTTPGPCARRSGGRRRLRHVETRAGPSRPDCQRSGQERLYPAGSGPVLLDAATPGARRHRVPGLRDIRPDAAARRRLRRNRGPGPVRGWSPSPALSRELGGHHGALAAGRHPPDRGRHLRGCHGSPRCAPCPAGPPPRTVRPARGSPRNAAPGRCARAVRPPLRARPWSGAGRGRDEAAQGARRAPRRQVRQAPRCGAGRPPAPT